MASRTLGELERCSLSWGRKGRANCQRSAAPCYGHSTIVQHICLRLCPPALPLTQTKPQSHRPPAPRPSWPRPPQHPAVRWHPRQPPAPRAHHAAGELTVLTWRRSASQGCGCTQQGRGSGAGGTVTWPSCQVAVPPAPDSQPCCTGPARPACPAARNAADARSPCLPFPHTHEGVWPRVGRGWRGPGHLPLPLALHRLPTGKCAGPRVHEVRLERVQP